MTSPLLRQVVRLMPSLTRLEPLSMPVVWNHAQPAVARPRYTVAPGIRLEMAALSWM